MGWTDVTYMEATARSQSRGAVAVLRVMAVGIGQGAAERPLTPASASTEIFAEASR